MSNTENIANDMTNPEMPVHKPADVRKSMHHFLQFLITLILICGIYILVTNGIYYWFSKPIISRFDAGSALLEGGVPADAVTEEARLAYYQSCSEQLKDLPAALDELNQQFWTFAVLIREDLGLTTVPSLLNKIERGKTAVQAYMAAAQVIKTDAAAYDWQVSQTDLTEGQKLADRLQLYLKRVTAADRLEELYSDLAKIPDADLAGPKFSRTELGVEQAAAAVEEYRQPVLDLQELMTRSDTLETQLNQVYALDPAIETETDIPKAFQEMQTEQEKLLSMANLQNNLPEPLQASFSLWKDGLAGRTAFIQALQTWLQNRDLIEQSLDSARTDRATAKRYLTASLNETNVATAYIWTKTAQEYRASMVVAIDFANIYVDRSNEQVRLMSDSRAAYRTALGLDIAVHEIAELETIDSEVFWIENN